MGELVALFAAPETRAAVVEAENQQFGQHAQMLTAQLGTGGGRGGGADGPPGLSQIDTRLIGAPRSFCGNAGDWPQFSTVLRAHVAATTTPAFPIVLRRCEAGEACVDEGGRHGGEGEGEELLMDYGESFGRCAAGLASRRSQETALATYSRVAPRIHYQEEARRIGLRIVWTALRRRGIDTPTHRWARQSHASVW